MAIFLLKKPLILEMAFIIVFSFVLPSLAHATVGANCSTSLDCNQQAHEVCVGATNTAQGATGTCQAAPSNTAPGSNTSPLGTNPGSNTSPPASSGTGLTNPLKAADLQTLLSEILQFVIQIGGIVIVLMLVFVGFKFVTAQGNSEALVSARTALLWTVIGAMVLLGAQAIATGIQATAQSL